MEALDHGLRGAALALFLLWAVYLWRDSRERLGAFFALGVASYTMCSSLDYSIPATLDWRLLLLAMCVGNPVMFWLFARRLFVDGFRAKRLHWALWAGYAVSGTAVILAANGPFAASRSALHLPYTAGTMGFALAAAWTIWRGHQDDLVEQRRLARPIMMSGAVLYALAIGISELDTGGAPPSPALAALNAAALAMFAFATLFIFGHGSGADLFTSSGAATRQQTPVVRATEADSEDGLIQRLLALFEGECLHRDPDLTVANVARRLAIPEHRLRALINRKLGHRNFAGLVNGFRLTEAKIALSDERQASVAIATIALDAGFGSLGVFNRAFKADTGMTPTAFRSSALRALG